MKRQRFPYLAILAISICANARIASGTQQPQRQSRKRCARSLGLPSAEKNHSRRRRRLGLHHIRFAHAPSLHLAPIESHRARMSTRKKLSARFQTRKACTTSPLRREFNRGFTSNGRASTVTIFDMKTLAVIDTVASGNESRCHRLRPRFEARLRDEWTQLEFHRDRCRHGKSRWHNCAKWKA